MACLKCAEALELAAAQIRGLLKADPSLLEPDQDWECIATALVQSGGRIREQARALSRAISV